MANDFTRTTLRQSKSAWGGQKLNQRQQKPIDRCLKIKFMKNKLSMNLRTLLERILGNKVSSLPLPKTAADIGVYQDNFEKAVTFTRQCGFNFTKVAWRGSDVLDASGHLIEQALKAAGVDDASKSAAQCLKWSHYLAPQFESVFGCAVWPTIGQIWSEDKPVFSPSWDDLKRWSQHGIQLEDFQSRKGINLHAWLTLESGEIIDPTFLSSLALANPGAFGKFKGALVWGRDPAVLNDHRYFPMAVGHDFAHAIGTMSVVPLLATNTEELHSTAILMHVQM